MRVPILNVHCALCGVATVLIVRVDNRMTTESLKESVLQQYHTFCRDEGIAFAPPSANPQDYAVYPATEQGVASSTSGLRPGRHSGETIRDQLVNFTAPYFLVISIGQAFLERDAVVQDESLERDVMSEKRNKLMQSLAYMEQVSCEKAIELQLFRERQENTVTRVEDMMLYAYVAYQRYHAKLDEESQRLRQLDQVWRERCIPWIRSAMEDVQTDKRVFLSASTIAVRSVMASLRRLDDSSLSVAL